MNKDFFKVGKLSGKGGAAVICLCLAAVAGVGIYTYNKSVPDAEQLGGAYDAENTEDIIGAGAVRTDIPKDTDNARYSGNTNTSGTLAAKPANVEPAANDQPAANEQPAEDTQPADAAAAQEEAADVYEAVDNVPVSENSVGIFVRPVDGMIVVPYSDGELIRSETLNVWKTHDGIDISAQIGEDVRSAAAGTVTDIYSDTMWGNCVVIGHSGGYESCYFGLDDDICVSEGDETGAGTVIGKVGDTAECEAAEEPHLHFAMKKNGTWIDPAEVLSGEGS